jgi:hypothetical protein
VETLPAVPDPGLWDFVAYRKQFNDVWFATRKEIAEWYLNSHHTHI